MEESNRRIFKNTIYLYLRQIVIMALSFVTTRIVLDKLGASDYGINTLVAGFVSMFTLLNSILQTGTRRFLALNLGKGDDELQKRTFSTAFVIHLLIAVVVTILLETLGLYCLNTRLNIEPSRMFAANWVFQFSVLTVFLNITQTPFTAAVTAHENFSIYAYLSIFEVVMKIAVLFLLVLIPYDKLIIYGFLTMLTSAIVVILYRIYCVRSYLECKTSFKVDKPLFKEMLSFSGWSTLGHVVAVTNQQGITILLNIFFNTVVNAARGLANTVVFTIQQFVGGFIMAAEPQLVKLFGMGDLQKFHRLIFNVSQYTLFLLSIIAVPVLMEIDYVLGLWLNEVPEYTSAFIKITIVVSVINYSNQMVDKGIIATGRMKEMSIYSTPIYLLTLPLAYIALRCGWTPTSIYYISMLPNTIVLLVNLFLLNKFTGFPIWLFFRQIFLKNIFLIIVSCLIPLFIHLHMEPGLLRFLVVCSVSFICTFAVIYGFGLNDETREMVKSKLLSRFNVLSR